MIQSQAYWCFLILVLICRSVLAADVAIQSRQVAKGQQIIATVEFVGQAGVESDLSETSSVQTVQSRSIPVGSARSPRLFFVRVSTPDGSSNLLTVFVTAINDNKFDMESSAIEWPPGQQPDDLPAGLPERFAESVAKNHYAVATKVGKAVLSHWLATNTVAVSGTVTICILPVLGAQAICIARIGDLVVDLGLDYASELISEADDLTADEKQTLKNWIQGSRTAIDLVKLARADKGLDQILKTATTGTNF